MKKRFKILFLLVPLVFALDQLIKLWIVTSLEPGAALPVLRGLFDIVHVTNRGAAFGLMAGLPDSVRAPFFHVTSCLALIAILIYYVRLDERSTGQFVGLSLILGGATGNIFDRIVRGEVIDFLSFHWYNRWATLGFWHFKLEWPAFNVADMAISLSVFWLIAKSFKK